MPLVLLVPLHNEVLNLFALCAINVRGMTPPPPLQTTKYKEQNSSYRKPDLSIEADPQSPCSQTHSQIMGHTQTWHYVQACTDTLHRDTLSNTAVCTMISSVLLKLTLRHGLYMQSFNSLYTQPHTCLAGPPLNCPG